jgi:hypothetical protein
LISLAGLGRRARASSPAGQSTATDFKIHSCARSGPDGPPAGLTPIDRRLGGRAGWHVIPGVGLWIGRRRVTRVWAGCTCVCRQHEHRLRTLGPAVCRGGFADRRDRTAQQGAQVFQSSHRACGRDGDRRPSDRILHIDFHLRAPVGPRPRRGGTRGPRRRAGRGCHRPELDRSHSARRATTRVRSGDPGRRRLARQARGSTSIPPTSATHRSWQ